MIVVPVPVADLIVLPGFGVVSQAFPWAEKRVNEPAREQKHNKRQRDVGPAAASPFASGVLLFSLPAAIFVGASTAARAKTVPSPPRRGGAPGSACAAVLFSRRHG